jgi:lipoyl(octanoyl) transferase
MPQKLNNEFPNRKSLSLEWLGPTDYSAGLEVQHSAWQRAHETGETTVLGLEHPPVITLGKRSNPALDLKTSLQALADQGIRVVSVDRGGEAVLHTTGQMVIYPIFNLIDWNLSVRDFVCVLEKTTIRFLEQLHIQARCGEKEPGIYTSRGKIGFIGIRVDRGVSRHGIAINISNELEQFRHIRCCGQENEKFDRLANYGVNATQVQLFRRWCECLKWSLGLTPPTQSAYSAQNIQRSSQTTAS